MKLEKFTSFDGTVLQCYYWDDVRSAKGVVQISHGMAEHARRYDAFAQYLNKNGYIVYADDHRAHGATVPKAELGYQKGNIFEDTVQDLLAITKMLKARYNLPVVFLGHSYGSFTGQRYLQFDSGACGVILSGSSYMKGGVTNMGDAIANMQYKLIGGAKKAKLMDKLGFSGYNKPFAKEHQPNAWLSRDKDNNKKYFFDEQCGFVCSVAFYKFFLDGMKNVYKPENLAKVNKDVYLRLFSGSCDPVGGQGKLIKKLYSMYKDDLSLSNVSLKLYEGARHEILNETNKSEVYADMLAEINNMVAAAK